MKTQLDPHEAAVAQAYDPASAGYDKPALTDRAA